MIIALQSLSYQIITQSMQDQSKMHINRLSNITKVGAALKKWKKYTVRSKDRCYRLKELISTEDQYYKDLNCIKDHIKEPLIKNQVITEELARQMFPSIQGMIGLSVELQKELKSKIEQWDIRTTLIGQTMIRFSKFLLVYSDYFKNFNSTQKRLQALVKENQKARIIEKQLSTEQRIVTFEDLISKPFQRPLKYHLILKDYASKIDQTHPDYLPLKEAISCYHKVNVQNNLAMENKEKDQSLVALDSRFGGIIDSSARYFVNECEAICIDMAVTIYILSDLIIISQKQGSKQKQFVRIHFNKYSHVQIAPDGHYFINRLFFYGKRICVHLTFSNPQIRNEIFVQIRSLIEEISNNEVAREEIIQQRTTRISVIQRRKSFTQLEPQFKRPMLANVLGYEKRVVGEEKTTQLFVLQFHPTPVKVSSPTPPHQITLVSFQTLMKIQWHCRTLYPELQCYSMSHKPRSLSDWDIKNDETKRVQFQSLFIQLWFNTVFRNDQVLKRIDLVVHLLKMSDALWLHLKDEQTCLGKPCCSKQPYTRADEYFKEKRDRLLARTQIDTGGSKLGKARAKQFCDIRTLHSQQLLAGLPASDLQSAIGQHRLVWTKSKLGWINHSLTFQRSTLKKKSCYIHFCNIWDEGMEVELSLNEKVKQVIDFIGQRLAVSLEDYALAAYINGSVIVLSDDQILADVLTVPVKKESGLMSVFSSIFKNEVNYPIKIFLKKMWVLEYSIEKKKPATKKISLEVEEIIYRLKNEEMRLIDQEAQKIYALYYAFKHFPDLNNLTLDKMNQKQIFQMVPKRLRNLDFIQYAYFYIDKIKRNPAIDSETLIGLKIIENVSERPGWSCFLFDGKLKGYSQAPNTQDVKIGCDLKGLHIREKGKTIMMLEFKMQSKNWTCEMSNLELIIHEQRLYSVCGQDMWKVKQQVDFYRLYYSSFLDEK